MRKILLSTAAIFLIWSLSSEKNLFAAHDCITAIRQFSALMNNPALYLELDQFVQSQRTGDDIMIAAGRIDTQQVGALTHISFADYAKPSALVILGEKNTLNLKTPLQISDGPFTHLEWVYNYGVFHLGTGADRIHQIELDFNGGVQQHRLFQPFGRISGNPKLLNLRGGGPGLSLLWSFYDNGTVFEIASVEKRLIFSPFAEKDLKVVSHAQNGPATFPVVQGLSDGSIRILDLDGNDYRTNQIAPFADRKLHAVGMAMSSDGKNGVSIYNGDGDIARWRIENYTLHFEFATKLEGYNPRVDPSYKLTGKPLIVGDSLIVPAIDKGKTYIDVFELAYEMSPRSVRWEMTSPRSLQSSGSSTEISQLLLSPDRKNIIAVSKDGFLGVIDIDKLMSF